MSEAVYENPLEDELEPSPNPPQRGGGGGAKQGAEKVPMPVSDSISQTLSGIEVQLRTLQADCTSCKDNIGVVNSSIGGFQPNSNVSERLEKVLSALDGISKEVKRDKTLDVKKKLEDVLNTVRKIYNIVNGNMSFEVDMSDVIENIESIKQELTSAKGELSEELSKNSVVEAVSNLSEAVDSVKSTVGSIPDILKKVKAVETIPTTVESYIKRENDAVESIAKQTQEIGKQTEKIKTCANKISESASSIYSKDELERRLNIIEDKIRYSDASINSAIDKIKTETGAAIAATKDEVKKAKNGVESIKKKVLGKRPAAINITFLFMLIISTMVVLYLNIVGISNNGLLISADVFLGVSLAVMLVFNVFVLPDNDVGVLRGIYYIVCGLLSVTTFVLSLVSLYI